METTPPPPQPRPRKQPVPILLESFPIPPTFIPSTPTTANPPPSGPPSTPLPPVPGPSRISEYDTLNLLFAASRYSHGGGRESLGSTRHSAGYAFSGPASPKIPAGRRASYVVSPVPSLGLDDELPALSASQRRARKGRRHNHQANESISEIDFRDILSSVSVMSDDDEVLVPPPSPFPKRPPQTSIVQVVPSPRDSASIPLASPLRRAFEDQQVRHLHHEQHERGQGHNYMASVADLIDPAFAPPSLSERPPITASAGPSTTSVDHPRPPDHRHPPVSTSSDQPTSTSSQDAAALHRQLRSTRSRSASHKQALTLRSPPPLDELPPPPSLGALPALAAGDTNGGLEPSSSILSTASTSGSLYSVATSLSASSSLSAMTTSSSMTMTTARTSPASVSPDLVKAGLSKSTITRSKDSFEGSESSNHTKSTPDLSKSTSTRPNPKEAFVDLSKSMSSLSSKPSSIPPRGTSPLPPRGTSPDIDAILSQTPKPKPRPARAARASDPLSRAPSASAYTMGEGKRRASESLLALGSHSSAYANSNSTTTIRASVSSSEGSGASLNYRSRRIGSGTTPRTNNRYSSNDDYQEQEEMTRHGDKDEIERLERALDGYGSGSSDDEGGGGRGVGRRGAGKGGKFTRGGRRGGGEEGDSDSSLDLHTPLPHLMLRHGLLSPNSKLLPHESESRMDLDGRPGSIMTMASNGEDPFVYVL
ncbi:uncharacterized protein LACBIDRAFT_309719 [Laccaria bicolor S238N-H82]|uniref:Predicted protein n=1 Tax=Laccaria bicolor (strain S238N-H82 / ATCC MYA-4686) TaxID=486041 RepID=B0DSX3_LACBS|nr:uncharacterized protein LACBIDRAFT_309719 [Laccaria bicolor S238N-H82]EDR02390.1 predicted protein [Laccaria bicolor S238N-H82]|eukprot:XP_001887067.1 predicted protein [Laccaria bicolor S238N-H82]